MLAILLDNAFRSSILFDDLRHGRRKKCKENSSEKSHSYAYECVGTAHSINRCLHIWICWCTHSPQNPKL